MISVPYVELEKKHEGRFFGILSHMAGLTMPLNYEGVVARVGRGHMAEANTCGRGSGITFQVAVGLRVEIRKVVPGENLHRIQDCFSPEGYVFQYEFV